MRPSVRRAATLVAMPPLLLAGLVVTSSAASADDPVADPAPPAAGAAWLESQLVDGLVLSPYLDPEGVPYADFGVSIDAAFALAAVGAPASSVQSVSDAVADRLEEYVAPGFGTDLAAGSVAKALVLAQLAGDDPTAFGGRNLVTDLEGRVATDGAIAGRIQDDWQPVDEYAGDFANVFGQAYAAQALDSVDSVDTDAVTDYLLSQQCAAGYFNLYFPAADASDQSCDANDGAPSVDATAVAVQSLQSQVDDTDVAAHVQDAVAWLLEAQKANGSFGSDALIPGANANSTGAAASALLVSGEIEAAVRAAAWLRAHQATNVGSCAPYADADLGAVFYDDADRTTARTGAMDAELVYKSTRATTQALGGLAAAAAGAGEPNLLVAPGYVRAGGATSVGVTDEAPGAAVCAVLGGRSVLAWAGDDGDARLNLRVPAEAGKHVVRVSDEGGRIGTATLHALGAKRLPISLSERVAPGRRQVVVVRGLAPAEQVSVSVRWAARGSSVSGGGTAGQANRDGVFRATFDVPRRPGTARVTVQGEFGNRAGATTFEVAR